MANLYGVDNTVLTPNSAGLIGGADVFCPAGVETNIIATPALIAPSNGYFVPMLWLNVAITFAATPATNVSVGARIGAGADFDYYNLNAALIVANATIMLNGFLSGVAAQVPWFQPGSVVYVSLNPTAQAVNARVLGSRALYWLARAQDQ